MRTDLSGAASDIDLVQLWLAGRPASTRAKYEPVVVEFLRAVEVGVKALTASHVIEWSESLQGADATRARLVSTVKSLLSFAWRTGYTGVNVGRILRCVKVTNRLHEKFIEEEQVMGLLAECAEGRDKLFVQLLYTGGLRIAEAVGLRFIDLSTRGHVSVVGKGQKGRTVLVPQSVINGLLALKGAQDGPTSKVFKSYRGKPLGVRDARDIVYKAADEAGVKLSPHWLRHAHASHALDHGCPIHLLQKSLGHANVATTSVYLHARPGTGASQYLPNV